MAAPRFAALFVVAVGTSPPTRDPPPASRRRSQRKRHDHPRMRRHRRTAARSPHVVPPPVRRARIATPDAGTVAPPPHTLQPPSPSWLATAISLAPSIVTTELPSFPFADPSPKAFSSLRLPQMKTTFAKRPQSQSSRMPKRHSHAVGRNRTDHGRPSHVAQYGIVVINGIDTTAKQHNDAEGGGATGLAGLRGVARQPELAGLRGRRGGIGEAELAGSATEGGWQGGAGEATGAGRLARGLRS